MIYNVLLAVIKVLALHVLKIELIQVHAHVHHKHLIMVKLCALLAKLNVTVAQEALLNVMLAVGIT